MPVVVFAAELGGMIEFQIFFRRNQPMRIGNHRLILAPRPSMDNMPVTQHEKAERFRALHDGPETFIIPNPWDAISARILTGLGFQALATSSAAAAAGFGRRDRGITRDQALDHSRSIVDATDVPVSADLEQGFG